MTWNGIVWCTVVPVLSRMEKSLNLVEGERLELECSGWGWPTPNITWRRQDPFNGVESNLTSSTIIVASLSPSPHSVQLKIEHVARSDYSKYMCVASNTVGSSNATVLVRVKGIAGKVTFV